MRGAEDTPGRAFKWWHILKQTLSRSTERDEDQRPKIMNDRHKTELRDESRRELSWITGACCWIVPTPLVGSAEARLRLRDGYDVNG
jgi:hypothetical protein